MAAGVTRPTEPNTLCVMELQRTLQRSYDALSVCAVTALPGALWCYTGIAEQLGADVSIRIELSEMEAAVIETLLNEATLDLENEMDQAEAGEDWLTFEDCAAEHEFLSDIASTIQLQIIDVVVDKTSWYDDEGFGGLDE